MAKKVNKKEILTAAAAVVATKKQRKISSIWQWIKKVARKISNINKLVFFNIILLGLLVAMLATMLMQVKVEKKALAVVSRPATAVAPTIVSAGNRPTVVVSRGNYVMPNQKPTRMVVKQYKTSILVDGKNRSPSPVPMSVVNGDLVLQNMRIYTLPCGIRIRGNLMLRNVEQLKFCGEFAVAGNIYVSSNSSFGPLPKSARLGGQVIF